MSFLKLHRLGAVAALVLAVVVGTQPAAADDASRILVANQVTVQYGDLNLQSPLAADILVKRIAQAARDVCGDRPALGPGFYVLRQRYNACLKSAQQNAIASVNIPSVTAAYERKLNPSAERLATR